MDEEASCDNGERWILNTRATALSRPQQTQVGNHIILMEGSAFSCIGGFCTRRSSEKGKWEVFLLVLVLIHSSFCSFAQYMMHLPVDCPLFQLAGI